MGILYWRQCGVDCYQIPLKNACWLLLIASGADLVRWWPRPAHCPLYLPSAGSRDLTHSDVPQFPSGFPTRFPIARPLAVRFLPKVRLWYPYYDYSWIPSPSLQIQISCASHLNYIIRFGLRLMLRPSTKDVIYPRPGSQSYYKYTSFCDSTLRWLNLIYISAFTGKTCILA